MKKSHISIFYFLSIILCYSGFVLADDVASVDRGSGSYLVTGSGGSTNAGGQSLSADDFTGAATYNIGIPVPPARGGIEPQLSLSYNSYNKNHNSWVGYGWELGVGMIERLPNHGHIDYYEGTNFSVSFAGQKETLILLQENIDAATQYGVTVAAGMQVDEYAAKVESAFNIYLHFRNTVNPGQFTDAGWLIIDKAGTHYYLGSSSDSRVEQYRCAVNADPDSCSNQHWVRQWLLDSVVDTNENTLNVSHDSAKYIASISYQDISVSFVRLSLAGGETYYPYYRDSFYHTFDQTQINKYLDYVTVYQDGTALQTFNFTYSNAPKSDLRFLTSVQQCEGVIRNGTDDECLPATTFDYYPENQLSWSSTDYARSGSTSTAEGYDTGLGSYRNQFIDMNADGLVDKVVAYTGSDVVHVFYNDGSDFVYVPGKSDWTDPFHIDECPDDPSEDGTQYCYGVLTAMYNWEGSAHQWLYLMDVNGDSLPDRVRKVYCADCEDPTQQTNFEIAFNTGTGWSATTVLWRDPVVSTFPGTADNGKFFMDFNGDGLIDRVAINVTTTTGEGTIWSDGFNVYYNTGAGFAATPVFWRDPIDFQADDDEIGRLTLTDSYGAYLTIRDFNGDGLPDRIFKGDFIRGDGTSLGTGISVFLNQNGLQWSSAGVNTGFGWEVNEIDQLMIIDKVAEDKGYINSTHDWIDFNGDGFLDRVEGHPDDNNFTVYYYRGVTPDTSAEQLSDGVDMADPVNDSGSCKQSGYISNTLESNDSQLGYYVTHTMTADFNGDTYPDRLSVSPCNQEQNTKSYHFFPMRVSTTPITYSDAPSEWVNQNVTQPVHALKSVDNGVGQETVIEYLPSSWPQRWSTHYSGLPLNHRILPVNLFLAHKLYVTDYTMSGADTEAEAVRHPGMRWTTYNYWGGNLYVDYAIKANADLTDDALTENYYAEFNGFQSVTKQIFKSAAETWEDMITETTYYQGLGDVDTVPSSDETLFEASAYSNYAFSGRPLFTSVEVGGVTKVFEENEYEMDSEDTADTFFCVDSCFPRLISHTKTVMDNAVSPVRESKVVFDHDSVGNVISEEYYDGDNNLIISKQNSYEPKTSFDTDRQLRNRPNLQTKELGGTVYRQKEFIYDSRGNPTQEQSFISGSNYAFVSRAFSSNGNLLSLTDIDNVTKTYSYDSNNLFPATERMALPSGTNLSVSRDFNRQLGQPEEELNETHVGTRTEYDAFGRPVAAYMISSAGVETRVKWYDYEYVTATVEAWTGIILLKSSSWEPIEGQADTLTKPGVITYADAAGYVLQKCALSEQGNYRMIVSRQTNGGQKEQISEALFSTDCAFQTTMPTAVAHAETQKDFQGRVVYQEPPAGDAGSPVSSLTYTYAQTTEGNLIKTITDDEDKSRVEIYDQSERLISVQDPMGNVLGYEYNPVGDLLRVTGDGQELIYMEYDKLGRKTLMRDANLGTWVYEYDANNHLYKQTDNAGNYSINQYDSAGRMIRTSYYNASGTLEKYVVNTHDVGDSSHSVTAGELFKVEEYDGAGNLLRTTRFGYDSLYHRNEKITRTIEGVGDFEQTFSYDTYGNLASITYPGGESLYYKYSKTGALEQECNTAACDDEVYYSVDPNTGYDQYGSLLAENYGNGVVKTYTYYPNSHRLQSFVIGKDSTTYSQRSYEYDVYSNIVNLSDPSNLAGSGALSAVQYDDLSRLTSYTTKTGATYSLAYDNQGNIITNSAKYADAYQYNSAKPHAVTNIGSATFTYDDNGNMLSDPDRTMTYNAQNQLTRVAMTNGTIIDYAHDYSGARVSKTVSSTNTGGQNLTNTVYYLGDAVELRGDDLIINIFAGDQKVATKSLGSLSELMGGTGASVNVFRGIRPVMSLSSMMSYVLLLLVLFIIFSFRTVDGIVVRKWRYAHKYGYRFLRFYHSYTRFVTETFYALPHNFATKVVCFVLVFLFSVQVPLLQAHAGDAGIPALPQSDITYTYYIHGDHLGSSHIMTEGKPLGGKHMGLWYKRGDLVQRIEYDPFGQEKFVLNPNLQLDPSYTGQKYDIESGLYYYKARYYNPKIGRFIQADTVLPSATDYQSFNRYAYVRNNPLKYVDPSGHSFWSWFRKIAGAFIGTLVGAAVTAVTMGALAGVGTVLAQVIISGAVGGLIGGAVAGAITGGMTGMMFGAIFGLIGGALGGGFSQGIAKLGMAGFALMVGAGAGLSYATGGWEGLLTFGVGLLGGYAGNKLGKCFGSKLGGGVSTVQKQSHENLQLGDELVLDPRVKAEMEQAFQESGDSLQYSQRHEQGGWIVEDKNGNLSVQRIAAGTDDSIGFYLKGPSNAVGRFHTHPYPSYGMIHGPSDADIYSAQLITGKNGKVIPSFVIDRIGVFRVDPTILGPAQDQYRDIYYRGTK